MFVNLMLPNLNSQGLRFIEEKFDLFCTCLRLQVEKRDCTWQRILIALDWQEEAANILNYAESVDKRAAKQIRDAIVTAEC